MGALYITEEPSSARLFEVSSLTRRRRVSAQTARLRSMN
jgi:hypothetical protein